MIIHVCLTQQGSNLIKNINPDLFPLPDVWVVEDFRKIELLNRSHYTPMPLTYFLDLFGEYDDCGHKVYWKDIQFDV